MFSTELRLALQPQRIYEQLVARDGDVTFWQMLARPATVVFAIALAIPMMTVHRVTFKLAATTAAASSVAVAIEFLAAICVIASVPSLRVSRARAIDLWFAGHMPYSLWLLALPVATLYRSTSPLEIIGVTATVPLLWTAFIVAAFCRAVLGTSPAGARWRAGIHLGAVSLVASTLFIIAAGGGAALFSYALRRIAE